MPNIFLLKIVDAPAPGTVSVIDFDAPGVKTVEGADAAAADLYCGQCGALLVAGMSGRTVRRTVIRCKLCRAYNDPSAATPA